MAKKSILSSNLSPNAQRLKQLKSLERHYQEWKNDFTLDYCFNSYVVAQMEKGLAPQTIYNYKYFYKKMLTPFIEKYFQTTPKEITVEVFETEPTVLLFQQYLKERGLGDNTLFSYMKTLKAFGRWCLAEGYMEDFHCTVKRVETDIKEVYTVKELEKLMVKPAITDFYDFRAYCMISLMLNTGARRRTLANIKICDLEIEEGYINFNTTKTGKVVRLGLERKTKRDLLEWLNYWRIDKGAKPTDYLFCNQYGEQLHTSTISAIIRHYNRSRGVEKTSCHLFRHTFAKMWITSGGDIISLARVLTHKELDMVKHYSNLYGGDIKKEIEEHSVISQMKTKSGKTLKNR